MDRDIEMQLVEAEELPVPPLSLESLDSLHSVTYTENEEHDRGKMKECARINLREKIHGKWSSEEDVRLSDTKVRHQGQCSTAGENETKVGKVTQISEMEHFQSRQDVEEEDENERKIQSDDNKGN